MRWQNGLFVPIGTPSTLDKLAADTKVEQAFLELLDLFTEQNQDVGPKKGPNYAPAKFEDHPKSKPFDSRKLAAAMQRARCEDDQDRGGRIEVQAALVSAQGVK
jgi:hypothetical protein